MQNEFWNMDALMAIPKLPNDVTMVFADPPDNRDKKMYKGFTDQWSSEEAYREWLANMVYKAIHLTQPKWMWLSIDVKVLGDMLSRWQGPGCKLFMWRYNFGCYQIKDCGSGFRPVLRLKGQPDAELYPDVIKVPSWRQRNVDKRAALGGRVPDDVWEPIEGTVPAFEIPRITGNHKERRRWHPTQHPEELIERMVQFCTKEGDLVVDLFAGTGTVNRVCERLKRRCIGIEISKYYYDGLVKEQK